MTMKDWKEKLDAFLKFNEQEILMDTWTISHEVAKELALQEYEKYKPLQDKEYLSDFDQKVQHYLSQQISPLREK
jgi:hypothetical protein